MPKTKRVYVVEYDPQTKSMFNHTAGYVVTDFLDINNPPDIIVYTGGPDVNPKLYGEEKIPGTHPSPEREAENIRVWDKFPAVPKVGICFGGQWLNVMSGGAMWQDVDGHGGDHIGVNLINIPGTRFKAGQELQVTSTHHQMMIPGPHAEVLMIAHKSKVFQSYHAREKPEFDTEVVWYESTKCLCFQPHPEYSRLPEHREYFFSLLEYLL